jgi:hypothetical protein
LFLQPHKPVTLPRAATSKFQTRSQVLALTGASAHHTHSRQGAFAWPTREEEEEDSSTEVEEGLRGARANPNR